VVIGVQVALVALLFLLPTSGMINSIWNPSVRN